jgi:hypothetical protein
MPVKRILIGLVAIVASEIGMLLQVEPFWSWHTPIAWTGYILLVDGVVHLRRGSSWLSDFPRQFAFLAVVSFPLWLVFEFYNLFIRNWHYVNLPESAFWRDVGYAWAFATIWPAIFETADLVASYRDGRRVGRPRPASAAVPIAPAATARPRRGSLGPSASAGGRAAATATTGTPLSRWGIVSIVIGAAMLAWPLFWPSRYLAAPVWLGFIFLLDPLNARAGRQSLTADCRVHLPERDATMMAGRTDRAINLMLAGLMCGFVWEFWNYWARTKWIYTVPILEHVKLFEMPLPGYLGFPAFALECFTMYVSLRLLLGRGDGRPIAL